MKSLIAATFIHGTLLCLLLIQYGGIRRTLQIRSTPHGQRLPLVITRPYTQRTHHKPADPSCAGVAHKQTVARPTAHKPSRVIKKTSCKKPQKKAHKPEKTKKKNTHEAVKTQPRPTQEPGPAQKPTKKSEQTTQEAEKSPVTAPVVTNSSYICQIDQPIDPSAPDPLKSIHAPIAAAWHPPRGIRPTRPCILRITLHNGTALHAPLVVQSSGIPAFDMAARRALLSAQFSRLGGVYEFELVFTQ